MISDNFVSIFITRCLEKFPPIPYNSHLYALHTSQFVGREDLLSS